MTNKETLDLCEALGIGVKSHSSSIIDAQADRVRRKAAQFSARKLLEVNVPCFGAVLNGLNLAVSGYYYAQYYDKSYKDYYVTMAKQDPGSADR